MLRLTERRASIAAAALLAASCGTITTLDVDRWGPGPRAVFLDRDACVPRIYSGTMLNARSMPVEPFVTIVDLPLSLVADTIVLPYTIFVQIEHGNYCMGERPRPE